MAQIEKCRWCDGEVRFSREEKSIGHSFPECERFADLMAQGPKPSRTEFFQVDANGDRIMKGEPS